MKKLLMLTALMLMGLWWQGGEACTTLCLQNRGQLLYARNFDYDVGGGYLLVNKRGVKKVALTFEAPARWESRYGSVTFNLYGREFPMGGMNEAGLVVENMWLTATEYPIPDSLPAVDNLQWIQYQLDNCATVAEVIERSATIRISGFGGAKIHYLITDAGGECAVLEYLGGKLVVHAGDTLPVKALTNTVYEQSVAYLNSFAGDRSSDEYLEDDSSRGRFMAAARAAAGFAESAPVDGIAYAFSVLDNVGSKARTQWKIVYDIPARQIHFRTKENDAVRSLAFDGLDFSCRRPVVGYDLRAQDEGPVIGLLEPYTVIQNRKLVLRVFGETDFLKDTPRNILEILAKYPESLSCAGAGR